MAGQIFYWRNQSRRRVISKHISREFLKLLRDDLNDFFPGLIPAPRESPHGGMPGVVTGAVGLPIGAINHRPGMHPQCRRQNARRGGGRNHEIKSLGQCRGLGQIVEKIDFGIRHQRNAELAACFCQFACALVVLEVYEMNTGHRKYRSPLIDGRAVRAKRGGPIAAAPGKADFGARTQRSQALFPIGHPAGRRSEIPVMPGEAFKGRAEPPRQATGGTLNVHALQRGRVWRVGSRHHLGTGK